MFRAPRVLKTQATEPPAGAAVSSSGNGALITCSTLKVDCCAGSAAGASRAMVRYRERLIMHRGVFPLPTPRSDGACHPERRRREGSAFLKGARRCTRPPGSVEPRRPPEQPAGSGEQGEHGGGKARDP